jgi:CRP/FNR family transcriptional regulator, cyclic AMP receptor protein
MSVSTWRHTPPQGGGIASNELKHRLEALSTAPILGALPKRHLRQIAKIAYVRPFREGTAIVKEGAVDSTFYLIVEGKARAEKGGKAVGRLKPGDFIGEIALFDPGPRAATVLADTAVTCVSIAGKDFRQLLEHEPALVTPILQVMARRLRSFLRSDL